MAPIRSLKPNVTREQAILQFSSTGIPRLFRNVAYGREGRSILIMVTPRVIINREEQERQTGVREDDFAGLGQP